MTSVFIIVDTLLDGTLVEKGCVQVETDVDRAGETSHFDGRDLHGSATVSIGIAVSIIRLELYADCTGHYCTAI